MKKEPLRIGMIMGKMLGGGVEAVIMNYYRHIDRSKIQFDFICDEDSTDIPKEEIEKLGGRVIICPPYQKLPKYLKELKRIFKENKYKIVHSNINTLSVFPLYAAKKAGVPIRIAHSHSTIVNSKKEWKRNALKNILKYFSKVFATNYFCCSDMAGITQFGKKTYDTKKVHKIKNAIEIDNYLYNKTIRINARKQLSIEKETLVIGHIGRFVQTKNHRFIIEVFKSIHDIVPNSELLLIGQGPLMNDIKQKVKELDLEESVRFLGQRSDAAKLYQAFDVFLLPSLYEGLPVVGVEAQASGTKTFFSSNVPQEAKIIDKAEFIDIDLSPEKWANIILSKMTDVKKENTKNEMTIKGYNIEVESKKLQELYFDFIKGEGIKC